MHFPLGGGGGGGWGGGGAKAPSLLGNLGAKFFETSFPHFQTYWLKKSENYPVQKQVPQS